MYFYSSLCYKPCVWNFQSLVIFAQVEMCLFFLQKKHHKKRLTYFSFVCFLNQCLKLDNHKYILWNTSHIMIGSYYLEVPVTEFIFHLIDNQEVLNFLLKNHLCVIISYILYAIAMGVVLKRDWKCQGQSSKVGTESVTKIGRKRTIV